MKNHAKIFIVEDERVISNFITALLTTSQYTTLVAATGAEAIEMAAEHNPDLILLDLGLPDMDGMQVLHRIREWSDVPIIVVSARQDEQEKVEALDAGANDYVTKPFGNSELLARIRTALRQHIRLGSLKEPAASSFSVGGLFIDYAKRRVQVEGKSVHLTPIEYKIVALLSQNAGKVLTRDFMIQQIWGPFGGDNQVLRVNMANIRRKIEENPADPRFILTEVGVGYRMID
ncbi:response regulator transcription factor [Oscillospiraceae bacterium MB08-C2-2]|nr:response regulator transcription factor [Oscillospiraceae bacterium MB08-C2-2]